MEFQIILERLGDAVVPNGGTKDVPGDGTCAVAVAAMIDRRDQRLSEIVEVADGAVERDGKSLFACPALTDGSNVLHVWTTAAIGQRDGLVAQLRKTAWPVLPKDRQDGWQTVFGKALVNVVKERRQFFDGEPSGGDAADAVFRQFRAAQTRLSEGQRGDGEGDAAFVSRATTRCEVVP